jgi:hypothetical protein
MCGLAEHNYGVMIDWVGKGSVRHLVAEAMF